MSGSEPKQRLVALDVGEVSIVDHPANEAPFVVTKAKTPAATAGDTTVTTDANVNKSGGVLLDPYTASVATLNAMRDCIYSLGDKLRDPSKLDDAKGEIERIRTMLDNAQQFAAMVTKAATDITAEVTKAKGEGKKAPPFMKEEMTKLVSTLKEAMGDDDDEETKTTKAIEAVEVILKAGKAQFSKERMAKLHEVFTHIGTMMKDADGEAFQKAVAAWTTPAPAAPAKVETPVVAKADEAVGAAAPAWFTGAMDGVKKALESATEATQAVTKRVEAIEKTEAVSKALPNNGTDNVKPVQKSESIWKGIV